MQRNTKSTHHSAHRRMRSSAENYRAGTFTFCRGTAVAIGSCRTN